MRWLSRIFNRPADARIAQRATQRADYLARWKRREPGYVRCQECLDVFKTDDLHDCRNPNAPITIVVR